MSEDKEQQVKNFIASYKALCIRHGMYFKLDYDGELWHIGIDQLQDVDKNDFDRISIKDFNW